MSVERLQRSLARAGFGSRRACEEVIAAGRVEINGRVATLGDRLDPAVDEVRVDGSKVNVDPELHTFALHKPRGVTTTMRDPHADRDLSGFLPKGVHVFPVGRLDRDTEGLLLLTNDGSLAHRLTHPRYAIEKEYLAEVGRPPSQRQLARLRRGVELDDGTARAIDARCCIPPESCHGKRRSKPVRFTSSRFFFTRSARSAAGTPDTSSGSATFLAIVRQG